MDPAIRSPGRRSFKVELVYSQAGGEGSGRFSRPRRGIVTFLVEFFGLGRFGGFGRMGRLHDFTVGT